MAFTIKLSKENLTLPADILAMLKERLAISRFLVDGITFKESKRGAAITLGKIRLRVAKHYCGNHPLPCPVRPGGERPHKHTTHLEGADWVAINDMVNDILDLHSASASVYTSLVIIRKGPARCMEYKPYSLNGIDNEWVRDSGCFANCIGKIEVHAKYPAGTPGIDNWRASAVDMTANRH